MYVHCVSFKKGQTKTYTNIKNKKNGIIRHYLTKTKTHNENYYNYCTHGSTIPFFVNRKIGTHSIIYEIALLLMCFGNKADCWVV